MITGGYMHAVPQEDKMLESLLGKIRGGYISSVLGYGVVTTAAASVLYRYSALFYVYSVSINLWCMSTH